MEYGTRRAKPIGGQGMSTETYLRIGHGTSRGRDTYGYNIVSLTDEMSWPTRRFRCMGGGYDMIGTVLAEWMTETHQDKLLPLADRAYYVSGTEPGVTVSDDPDAFYGMWRYEYGNAVPIAPIRVALDGGCGVESIQRIIKAAGLALTRTHDKRGNTTGWLVAGDES